MVFFVYKWKFLTSEQAYSVEFFHYHLSFELAFQSLDALATLPTWLPMYQGGRALFPDMLFYYSPFSIDFIPTYVLAKFLGLDQTLGPKIINIWRITLLTVIFAFGCRKLAREILENKFSSDFVFVVVLFSTGLAIPHYPTLATANVFFPWILFYLVRVTEYNPERFVHIVAGMALFAGASLFHLFNQNTFYVWVVILFFGTSLLISNAGRPFIKMLFDRDNPRHKTWVLVLAGGVFISILPVLWEMVYFFQNNYLMRGVSSNWEQIQTLINMPGMRESNIAYLGIIPFVLFSVGLFFGQNKYRKSTIWGFVGFGLTLLFASAPFLGIPIMALIAGMGLDRVMASNAFNTWKENKRGRVVGSIKFFSFFGLVIFYVFYWVRLIALNHVFQDMSQSIIYILALGLVSILVLVWVCRSAGYGAIAVFVGVVMLDFGFFDYLVNTRSAIHAQNPKNSLVSVPGLKETRIDEISVLKAVPQFSQNRFSLYRNSEQPMGYAPRLQQYGGINNKFYSEQAWKFPPNMLDAISGYSLPRAFFVENGFEDFQGEISTKILKSEENESLLSKVVFINESIDLKYEKILRVRKYFGLEIVKSLILQESLKKLVDSPSDLDIVLKRNYINVSASSISSNLSLNPSLLENLLNGRDYELNANQQILGENAVGWIIIDFGEKPPQIDMIEILYKSSRFFKNWMWDGSRDGETWERLGYFHPSLNAKGGKQEWPVVRGEGSRYYRLALVTNSISLKLGDLPVFKLAQDERKLGARVTYRDSEAQIPFIRFSNLGLSENGQYFIFGYDIGTRMTRNLSTEPTQRFGYLQEFKWKDQGRSLTPTWSNDWSREDLFQLGYLYSGYLSINVPINEVMKYRQRVLHIKAGVPAFGIEISKFSANRVSFRKNNSEAGWLYYADTWDKYWQATASNGETMPVNRANLQFKAVFVDRGQNVIEFVHQPSLFYQLVGLTYGVHILIFLIWIGTKRNKVKLGMLSDEGPL